MKTLYPRNFWQALLLLFAGFISGIFLPFLQLSHHIVVLLTGVLLCTVIWCVFYLINRKNGHHIKYSFTNEWNSPVLLLSTLFVVAFMLGVDYPIVHYLGHALGLIKEDGGTMLSPLYVVVFISPLLEELAFRGSILHGLLGNMSRTRAVVLSAALFAAIHLLPHQMIGAFAFGVLFGIVYSRTRNLGHTIVLHIIANAMGMCTNHIYGHSAPHNSLHIFLPALAATVAITMLLVKHLHRNQLNTNNITTKADRTVDKGACPLA